MCVHVQSLQSCLTLCDPMNFCAPGFSVHVILQQEYWSGLLCPPPGDFSDPGIEPVSHLAGGYFFFNHLCHLESPFCVGTPNQVRCNE